MNVGCIRYRRLQGLHVYVEYLSLSSSMKIDIVWEKTLGWLGISSSALVQLDHSV